MVTFWDHPGPSLLIAGESLYAAFVEMAAPDHDLIEITDVVNRCYLTARKLFAVLMRQYLQLELLTI